MLTIVMLEQLARAGGLDKAKINELQESTGHSVFSPSSMKRIMLCPGSVLAELHSPIPESSIYAEKGTLLHDYCEKAMMNYLQHGDNPINFVWDQTWEWEDKMLVVAALEYVLEIEALHTRMPIIELEARGSLDGWGIPSIYGTMDVKMMSPYRIDVLDYKFGHGIQVFAKDNPQCACYLGGAIPYPIDGSKPDVDLHVHIVQPTLNHLDPWDVEWEDLTTIILGDIQDAITKATSVNPSFAPSMEACRWCNAKMLCEHRLHGVQQNAAMVVQASTDPTTVQKEKWRKYLDAADDLQQAIKDMRLYAQDEIRSGRGFPGYKMVAGRSTRKWRDEDEALELMEEYEGAEPYAPKKLISLPQAEKLIKGIKKDQRFKDLIEKTEGKPVLQKESHPKAAMVFAVDSVFADIAAEDGEVVTIDDKQFM